MHANVSTQIGNSRTDVSHTSWNLQNLTADPTVSARQRRPFASIWSPEPNAMNLRQASQRWSAEAWADPSDHKQCSRITEIPSALLIYCFFLAYFSIQPDKAKVRWIMEEFYSRILVKIWRHKFSTSFRLPDSNTLMRIWGTVLKNIRSKPLVLYLT